jgi:hypothetical protein
MTKYARYYLASAATFAVSFCEQFREILWKQPICRGSIRSCSQTALALTMGIHREFPITVRKTPCLRSKTARDIYRAWKLFFDIAAAQ